MFDKCRNFRHLSMRQIRTPFMSSSLLFQSTLFARVTYSFSFGTYSTEKNGTYSISLIKHVLLHCHVSSTYHFLSRTCYILNRPMAFLFNESYPGFSKQYFVRFLNRQMAFPLCGSFHAFSNDLFH